MRGAREVLVRGLAGEGAMRGVEVQLAYGKKELSQGTKYGREGGEKGKGIGYFRGNKYRGKTGQ